MTIQLFPTLIGAGFPKRTPIWSTDVQISASGRRSALAWWSYPAYRYEIPYDILRSDVNQELQTLMAFYNTMQGRAGIFRFNDVNDTVATAQQFGIGDGVTKTFQLLRAFGPGPNWNDPVFYPNTTADGVSYSNPVIFKNGVAVGSGGYSIVNGLVTFTAAPAIATVLTWTGTYDWLCRFDDDSYDFEQLMQTFWNTRSVKFSTEKL